MKHDFWMGGVLQEAENRLQSCLDVMKTGSWVYTVAAEKEVKGFEGHLVVK